MDEPKQIHDWILICVLGAGAFGKVSLWRNKTNQEDIAVKKCKFQLPNHLSDRQRERWVNEVEIIKSMNCENIISYKKLPQILKTEFEKYNPTHLPILSMEYCSKGNLRTFLLQTKNLKGCQEMDVKCITMDITNAISYLHDRNITHRDIKPENIVIQECQSRPRRSVYKLIDLGYAKELETIASFVGTLPYLAPEMFFMQLYTNSVDYWSLGILTYEIITGEHPFMPNKTPFQRFEYLKNKSDDDICISILRDGKIKYSSEILLDNHLSSIFKKDIEKWLQLLLVYDNNKRGFRNKERINIFTELETLLNKKVLQVFSVFNYRTFHYEITEATTLSDIKSLIERDTLISQNLQIFVIDTETVICDDAFKMANIYEASLGRVLYVFKKNDNFERRMVTIPHQVQFLFQQVKDINAAVLKKIYLHAIFFISQENRLLQHFNAALTTQIDHTILCYQKLTKVYNNMRSNLLRLTTQIECYFEVSREQKPYVIPDNTKYINCLDNSRKYLRQAKELTENFNSLTSCLLKCLQMEWVSNHAAALKNALRSSMVDMTKMHESAVALYQKINNSNLSSTEMVQVLSTVLKIPNKMIFTNTDLKTYLRCVLSAQRKLQKLFIWGKAIDTEINRVFLLIQECQKVKAELVNSSRLPLSFPNYIEEDTIEINQLINENQYLRYQIQEISNEGSTYLRNIQKDMMYFWNGVVLPASQS